MREMLVMTSLTSVRPYVRPLVQTFGWRWGGRIASGDRSVRAIFLGGKSRDSVPFGNPRFLAANHISDEQTLHTARATEI